MGRELEELEGFNHHSTGLTKAFKDSDSYRATGLTGALETLYGEDSDEWAAEFDRYAAKGEHGTTEHELDTEEAVLTLTYTAGFPGESLSGGPEGVPEHEAVFTLRDANLDGGNNGTFYVDEDLGRVAAELELGRAYSTEEGTEYERGSIVLTPSELDEKPGSLEIPDF